MIPNYDETTQTVIMVLSIFEGRYDYSPESGYQRLILWTGKIEGSGTSKSTTWVDSCFRPDNMFPILHLIEMVQLKYCQNTGQFYVTYFDVYS